jgi:hypothetical protein
VSERIQQLADTTAKALDHLPRPRSDAGGSLTWAAFNLGAARVGEGIVEALIEGTSGFLRLQRQFHESWDVMEVAAMSLSFEDTHTSLDLCANAIYLASGGTPSADGSYKGMTHWKALQAATLPANCRAWVEALASHPDTGLLKECRHALSHRSVRRDLSIGLGSVEYRTLIQISIPPVPGTAEGRPLGSIEKLIPGLVRFGEDQFAACCAALRADYGQQT